MTAVRVIFFGTPRFAVPTLERLLASSHTVAGVVTQPDRPRGRGQLYSASPVKAVALRHDVPVFQPTQLKDPQWQSEIRAVGADIGVVVAYGRILPRTLLDIPPMGLINVHASLLPRWRGAAPIHRAVIAGDAVTGVTIMRVVLALDAGPMLSTVETVIDAADTSETLELRLADAGAALLVETLDRMASETVTEVAQDESRVTYAERLQRAERAIIWTRTAVEIDRQVRGLQPWPLAVARIADRAVALLHSAVVSAADTPASPGTIVRATGDQLHVACGSGVLAITQVKPEGRRPMPARAFLNGAGLSAGMVIT